MRELNENRGVELKTGIAVLFTTILLGTLLFGCIGGGEEPKATATPTVKPTVKATATPTPVATAPPELDDEDVDASDSDPLSNLGDDLTNGDELEIDDNIEGS